MEHNAVSAFLFDMPSERRPAQSFRDLLVWQKAHRLVLAIYQFTGNLPKQETYGLSLQMRRAASRSPPISPKASASAASRTRPAS